MANLAGMDISTGKEKSGGRLGKKKKLKQNESGIWVFMEE